MNTTVNSINETFKAALQRLGVDVKAMSQELAVFTAQKAAELAMVADDPNFAEAAIASGEQVLLHSATHVVLADDKARSEFKGVILGVIMTLAKLAPTA